MNKETIIALTIFGIICIGMIIATIYVFPKKPNKDIEPGISLVVDGLELSLVEMAGHPVDNDSDKHYFVGQEKDSIGIVDTKYSVIKHDVNRDK